MRRAWAIATLTAVLAGLAGPVSAAAGDLDTTFSGDGQVSISFAQGGAEARSVAIQSDGKIVTAGWVELTDSDTAWVLNRFKPNGALDPTFSGDGKVMTDWTPGDDQAWGVVVQKSGRIVAAGWAGGKFAAARYTSDGKPDPSFGNHGKVVVDFGLEEDKAWAVARAPGGKVVLAGQAGAGDTRRFALARLNGNGTLDDTFGGDGRVTDQIGAPSYAWAMVVSGDGSVVATGNSNGGSLAAVAIVKFTPSGHPDPDFGDSGFWVADAPVAAFADAIVRMKSGKYMVGATMGSNPYDVGLIRFTEDGHQDDTFGTVGVVTRDYESNELVTGMQRTGSKLVMSIYRIRTGQPSELGAVRLLGNGEADTSFGDLGLATATLANAAGHAVAIQGDGRIVVAGRARPGSVYRVAVARFLAS